MKNNMAQGGISRRRMRMVQFVSLAVAADIGFVCVELAIGMNPLTDIAAQRPFLYLYVFLGTIAAFGIFGAMVGSREDLLEEMALRDSLTGLFNARYLQIRLDEELAAAGRHRTPMSYVLFDIDHFKRVNDEHGHPVGDRMLRLGALPGQEAGPQQGDHRKIRDILSIVFGMIPVEFLCINGNFSLQPCLSNQISNRLENFKPSVLFSAYECNHTR